MRASLRMRARSARSTLGAGGGDGGGAVLRRSAVLRAAGVDMEARGPPSMAPISQRSHADSAGGAAGVRPVRGPPAAWRAAAWMAASRSRESPNSPEPPKLPLESDELIGARRRYHDFAGLRQAAGDLQDG
ncbi:MAG TPA: hypothetical protein VIP05_10035, partial [Burkholderiaceae bacterium]